jgi:hypothetical protein
MRGSRPRECVRAGGGADVRRYGCRSVTIGSRPYSHTAGSRIPRRRGRRRSSVRSRRHRRFLDPPRVRAYGVPENFREVDRAHCWVRDLGLRPPCVTHPTILSLQIDASRHDCRAAADYRTSEKAAGIISLFSCRTGRTPVCAGHAPPGRRDSSRTRVRSLRSLYTQV